MTGMLWLLSSSAPKKWLLTRAPFDVIVLYFESGLNFILVLKA